MVPHRGALDRTRTCNLLIRSQMLYPIELRAQLSSTTARRRRRFRSPRPGAAERPFSGGRPLDALLPAGAEAPDGARRCPREDSNLHAVAGTGPSNQPVYQFQHVGLACHARKRTRTSTGIPPQDPESCASTNSATRAYGAEGSRTPDLLNAIQALSQLSYSPGKSDPNCQRSERGGRDSNPRPPV